MNALKKLLIGMGKFELVMSCVALVYMAVAYGLEIASRKVFASSFIFVQETAMLAWVFLVFLAASYVFKIKRATVVDFIFDRFPPKAKRIVGIMIYLVTIIFCVSLIDLTLKFIEFQKKSTTAILEMPENLYSYPVLYAGVSILLTTIYDIIVYWREDKDPVIR